MSVRSSQPAYYYTATGFTFAADAQQIAEDLDIIRCCRPGLVTLGGDWLDILLAQQQYGLIDSILGQMEATIPVASRILLGFHPSTGFLQVLRERSFAGAAVPVSLLNMQCAESYSALRQIKARSSLYAVHCLAGGEIPLEPAHGLRLSPSADRRLYRLALLVSGISRHWRPARLASGVR